MDVAICNPSQRRQSQGIPRASWLARLAETPSSKLRERPPRFRERPSGFRERPSRLREILQSPWETLQAQERPCLHIWGGDGSKKMSVLDLCMNMHLQANMHPYRQTYIHIYMHVYHMHLHTQKTGSPYMCCNMDKS